MPNATRLDDGTPEPSREPPWPDALRVQSGSTSWDLAPEGIRHLVLGGDQVAVGLYAAIRAADWSTLPLTTERQAVDVGPERCLLRRHEFLGDVISSQLTVGIEPLTGITADLEVTVHREVELNRWGLNVLLDAAGWEGADVVHDGHVALLARGVAPQNVVEGRLQGMFPPAHELSLTRADGTCLRLNSTGPVLEMEDQRNWSDPTYKIYAGSLRDPWPVRHLAGAVLRQRLVISVAPSPASPKTRAHFPTLGARRALPYIGVQSNDGLRQPVDHASLLSALMVDHVRLDVGTGADLPALLARTGRTPVELAVMVDDVEAATLTSVAAMGDLLPPASRLLVHPSGRVTTGVDTVAEVAGLLARPDLLVVPGSDAYYANLNRERRAYGPAVSFGIVPTVHAVDSESVFGTLAVQQRLVEEAAGALGARAVVSPVTLRPRGDPESPDNDAASRVEIQQRHIDPRTHALANAAWTVGSVHAIVLGGAAGVNPPGGATAVRRRGPCGRACVPGPASRAGRLAAALGRAPRPARRARLGRYRTPARRTAACGRSDDVHLVGGWSYRGGAACRAGPWRVRDRPADRSRRPDVRQLVLEGPGDLRLVEVELPVPGPGEVRVLVHVAGICGSDLHGYRNDNGRRAAGTVMGHELSGWFDAAGSGVESWVQGDAVVVNPLLGCGSCPACLDGLPNRCPTKTIIGCTPRWPGAFSEALVVPASALTRWSGPAPLAWGALVEPLAVGFQAVQAAEVTGRQVLVIGSGGVGVGVAIAARRQGARSITVMDRDSRRREQMAHLDLTMTTMTTVRDVAGTGAYDTVIDCVADSETLATALGASRAGSVVVVVGLGRETAELALTPLVQGERTLRGSAQYTPAIFREVAEWVMTRPIDLSPLLSSPVKMADAPALFAGWDDDRDRFVRVVLQP